VEPGSIYGGNPAKKIKDVDPEQTHTIIDHIANNYKMYAGWYLE
jgi:carbonic anhydrase/acetyltransferase-like protein (isoleucine patch superfamily)